jgi:DNA invertase Pin-like site-specific DNA recombinase/predicted metal-dependent hydrolase
MDTATKTPRTKVAYSYKRFSTPEQAKGDSLRRQTAAAEEWCEQNGYLLDTELNLFDAGVSAFRGKNAREGGALYAFQRAVDEGIVEEGSVLLVESMDRLSRQTPDLALDLFKSIVRGGVDVVTLRTGRRFTKQSLKSWDFIEAFVEAMRAHSESEHKSGRLKAAWSEKRKKVGAKRLTRTCPAWIEPHGEGFRLIPQRAAVVRRIVDMVIKGKGTSGVAKALNEDGTPAFGKSKHWHRSYIIKILENPALVGTFIPHTADRDPETNKLTRVPSPPVPGYYPAAIDETTHARLEAAWARPRQRGRYASTVELLNTLSGLAKCPRCEASMTRTTKGKSRKRNRPRFVCSAARLGACVYTGVDVEQVENALIEGAEWIIEQAPTPDTGAETAVAVAEQVVFGLERKLETLSATLTADSSLTMRKLVAKVEDELRAAERERQEAEVALRQSATKLYSLKAAEFVRALRMKPMDRRRANAAMRAMLSKIVIDYPLGRLGLHWLAGGETSVQYAMPKDSTPGGYTATARGSKAVAGSTVKREAAKRPKRAAVAAALEGNAQRATRAGRAAQRR